MLNHVPIDKGLIHFCPPGIHNGNPSIRCFCGSDETLNIHLIKDNPLLAANEDQVVWTTPVVKTHTCPLTTGVATLLLTRKIRSWAKSVVAGAVSLVDCNPSAHAAVNRFDEGLLGVRDEETDVDDTAVNTTESESSPDAVVALMPPCGCSCTLMGRHSSCPVPC